MGDPHAHTRVIYDVLGGACQRNDRQHARQLPMLASFIVKRYCKSAAHPIVNAS
jgi:hypothetical protein